MIAREKGILLFLVLGLVFSVGCRDKEEEELNKQIQAQVAVIDREVQALEKNQEAMRGLVADMQSQLDLMQEELNQSAPRIHAATGAVTYLGELTTIGFGESPASYTVRNPAWTWTTGGIVILFVFILWLFYRLRHHSTNNQT